MVTAADVRRAVDTIAADVVRTPLVRSTVLSALTGAEVWVKQENLQFTGSFKDRGAANHLRSLSADERARGVIAVSAGNHAQGVAYHAGRLGIEATIVMPRSAPFTKVVNTEALGAKVVQEGATLAEAVSRMEQLRQERGLRFVPPYDDEAVIAGQGTVALEMLADQPDLDVIIAPVGGGGLVSGIALAARDVDPSIEIVGVQVAAYPAVADLKAGRPVSPPSERVDTLADGIAVKAPGELTAPIIVDLVDDVVVVSEQATERAIATFLEIEKTVAEGAGAVALAALFEHGPRFAGRRVGLVLSGGNIDTRVLASVLMRALARTGRVSTLRVTLLDLPGQLAPVVAALGEAGANIIEVDHRRLFDPISARSTNIDIVIEARDRNHRDQVVAAVKAVGNPVELVDTIDGG